MSRRTKRIRFIRSQIHRLIDSGHASPDLGVCEDEVLPRAEAERRGLTGPTGKQFLDEHDGTDQARLRDVE